MYFMSDPQTLHVTRNVIPGKLGVDLHLHRVHIPLVLKLLRQWSIGVLAPPPMNSGYVLHRRFLKSVIKRRLLGVDGGALY